MRHFFFLPPTHSLPTLSQLQILKSKEKISLNVQREQSIEASRIKTELLPLFNLVRKELETVRSLREKFSRSSSFSKHLQNRMCKFKTSYKNTLKLYAMERYSHIRGELTPSLCAIVISASKKYLTSEDTRNVLSTNSDVRKSVWSILESTTTLKQRNTTTSLSATRLWSPAKIRLFRSLTMEGKRDRVMKKLAHRIEVLEDTLSAARLRNENLNAQVRSESLVRQQMLRTKENLEIELNNSALKVSQLLQQAASDREVISYLDKRSKDLDRENVELREECRNLKESCSELKRLTFKHERRIHYLELLQGAAIEE